MNVYDCANELAKAMRESQEYKKLKEAKAALEQAEARYNKMTAYFNDASFAAASAINEVDCILSEI